MSGLDLAALDRARDLAGAAARSPREVILRAFRAPDLGRTRW